MGLGLEIKMICPDHGVIWRKNPSKIIDAYVRWVRQEPQQKAVVIYDTMWHSTEKMAENIVAGIIKEGVSAIPLHLRKLHRSEVMTEVFDAKAVVLGSPTLNNQLYPSLADFISYMKGLKPLNKIGAAFGSYGWSGEAVGQVMALLKEMKLDVVGEGIRAMYVPDAGTLKKCREFGVELAGMIGSMPAVKDGK